MENVDLNTPHAPNEFPNKLEEHHDTSVFVIAIDEEENTYSLYYDYEDEEWMEYSSRRGSDKFVIRDFVWYYKPSSFKYVKIRKYDDNPHPMTEFPMIENLEEEISVSVIAIDRGGYPYIVYYNFKEEIWMINCKDYGDFTFDGNFTWHYIPKHFKHLNT